MGAAETGGKASGRHVYGPRPLAAVLPTVLRPAFRRRAPATAQVLADWEAIVGPAIAAIATPRKLFGGTLSIACSGPVAMELQHLAGELMGRINGHLGRIAVTRLRFFQDVPAAPARPRERLPPATEAARKAVADLPPGRLRDALESLGAEVLRLRG